MPGLETFAGVVFLNQLPQPPPLRDSLGDLPEKLRRYDMDDMELFSQKRYDIGGAVRGILSRYHILGVPIGAM